EQSDSWYCYNGTNWEEIRTTNTTQSGYIYEEAMFWAIETTYEQGIQINLDNITNEYLNPEDEWIFSCQATDINGLVGEWTNSTTTTIQQSNTPPTIPIPDYPDDGDIFFINRTPTYNWTESTDEQDDNLTYDLEISTDETFTVIILNQTNISNNNHTQPTELDFDTYYWKVRAYDGSLYSNWSNTTNFTLVTNVDILIVQDNVSFGTLNPKESDNTTDNNPEPFQFISNSNTYIDLYNTTPTQSLWTTESLGTEYWKIKARNESTGNYNESGSLINWLNVNESIPDLITYLNYSTNKNNASIDIYIKGPDYEPPGSKQSTINFYWEAS
ncbi:hypothetical protein K9L97_02805, partial [Candidatus Woesearchaeota archaeon]|nr:hypothetical protein [Candidatus Woesearchaeota archaeon]